MLLVPDGMGIRNFLCSRFIEMARPGDTIRIWHALPPETVARLERRFGSTLEWLRLPRSREPIGARLLRLSKVFGQLYWQREPGTDFVLRQLLARRDPASWLGSRAASPIGRMFGSTKGLARLERWHARAAGQPHRLRAFETVLRRTKPDVVFCTHQRASLAVPAMLAARRLGIPTATFVYSWDNLPKGRMAVPADRFLVWSDHMKAELLRYYPEVEPHRVEAVGTPQFEPYFDRRLIRPREAFLRGLGLDPARPVVCFSGDDRSTSPCDPSYLADLAEALRSIDPARRPQLLFRRCPVDRSDRYREVLQTFPEIVASDPLWTGAARADWTGVVPDPDDLALLSNVVHHCDLVVNVASTMAMDFAMVGKPAVYLAYEPAPPASAGGWRAADLYRLPHLRTVHELQPVHWVRARDRLADTVAHALSHPEQLATARAAWIRRHVQLPVEGASERCYEALRRLAFESAIACTSVS
jgi:hypothetical protein